MLNLEEIWSLVVVASLGLALVVASPALGLIVSLDSDSEGFSELTLLGPDHMAGGYPFDVSEGEEYSVFVGVGNHLGHSEFYRVCVKLTSSTEFLSDIEKNVASSMPCLYEYQFFLGDGEVWESLVSFGFEDVSLEDDILSVGNITLNDFVFPVDASLMWNSDEEGYFFELFFELWRYDLESASFRFDGRFVGLCLSITA